MTRIECRSDLKRFEKAKARYLRTKRELEELENLLTSVTMDYTKAKVKSTPDNDKMAESVDKLNALHKRIIEQGNEAIEEMWRVKDMIDLVKNDGIHDILSRRYIQLQHWSDIAAETHYSISRLHQIDCKGIDMIIKRLYTIIH